jgi:hypothetical protein
MTFNFRNELSKICPKITLGAKIYIFGVGGHWCYFRNLYKTIAGIDLIDDIEAFVDNDTSKQGTIYEGKKIISADELDLNTSVVMISIAYYRENVKIGYQLIKQGFIIQHDCFPSWLLDALLFRFYKNNILKYAAKHQGERCFIIGNGASLTTNDLEKISLEKTFATNKIYKIYKQTQFRPTYYVAIDYFILDDLDTLTEQIHGIKFLYYNSISDKCYTGYDKHITNTEYFSINWDARYSPEPFNVPKFSNDISFVYNGATVTYSCLQLAINMGFKEIYLIGVDNSFNLALKNNGELVRTKLEQDHFSSEYDTGDIFQPFKIDFANSAYQSARDYADSHGIKIYNATRGGKLDVFERIDFDTISGLY